MLNKYIITMVVGAVLSALSYAAEHRDSSLPGADAVDTSVVEVPLLAVVPPKPDDKNIVAEGPQLASGAYKSCPDRQEYRRSRCQTRWTCRGPVRRIVFAPLRWLFGRPRC